MSISPHVWHFIRRCHYTPPRPHPNPRLRFRWQACRKKHISQRLQWAKQTSTRVVTKAIQWAQLLLQLGVLVLITTLPWLLILHLEVFFHCVKIQKKWCPRTHQLLYRKGSNDCTLFMGCWYHCCWTVIGLLCLLFFCCCWCLVSWLC